MQNGNENSGVVSIWELTANLGRPQEERRRTGEEIEREEVIQRLAREAQEQGIITSPKQLQTKMEVETRQNSINPVRQRFPRNPRRRPFRRLV